MGDKMKHLQMYKNFVPLLVIAVTVLLTVLYMYRKKLFVFFIYICGIFKSGVKNIDKDRCKDWIKKLGGSSIDVYYKRGLVFTLFGILPILMIKYIFKQPLRNFGYGLKSIKSTIVITLLLYTVSLPVILIASRSWKLQNIYPEVRESIESKLSFLYSAISYILFYFGYEALYRGFLLFGLREYLGEWTAIIISMGFASVSHLNTPGSVFLASVITGILFPWINLRAGSLWPVFLAHSGIGVSMDFFCLKRLRILGTQEGERARSSQY